MVIVGTDMLDSLALSELREFERVACEDNAHPAFEPKQPVDRPEWVSARAVDMPIPPVNVWPFLAWLSLGGATIGSVVAAIVFGAAAGWAVAFLFVVLWVMVTERRP